VDAARARYNQKRGGDVQKVSLSEALAIPGFGEDLIALDDALDALLAVDERKARIVEMRFFTGLEMLEIAAVLDVSIDTVKRDWKLSKAWLRRELKSGANA